MKHISAIILFIFVSSLSLFSTPQARDVLYWNNNKYYIFPFIDIEGRLNHTEWEVLNTMKTANPPTGNYRGFQLCFEIKNDSLFLISVWDSNHTDLTGFVLGEHTKRLLDDFTDTLYLGYGESYWYDGFWTPIYESEKTVFVQNGIVQWTIDNANKTKHSPYPDDIQLFMDYIYSNIRWDSLDTKTLLSKPKVFLGVEIDSINRIEKVIVKRSSGYAEFDEEAIRVVKSLPSVSVYFVKGKYIHQEYIVPVLFDKEKATLLDEKTKKDGTGIKQTIRPKVRSLDQMLIESIKTSKNKYDSFASMTSRNYPLLLCCDGLPIPYIEQNKPFYESIGLETMTWLNTKKHQKELKQGVDIIEVHYYLIENSFEVYVHFVTAKKEKKQIDCAYWLEDVDKYHYQYSCETNEWIFLE